MLLAASTAWGAAAQVSAAHAEEGTAVTIAFRADAGEQNRLTVLAGRSAGGRQTVVFRDAGAAIRPGAGCRTAAPGAVSCTAERGDVANAVTVNVGDGDDTVDAGAFDARDFTVTFFGKTGADRLIGSRALTNSFLKSGEEGNDVFIGGGRNDHFSAATGNDRLDGGAGRDAVSYGFRRAATRIDLAAGGATSEGESDALRSIEDATGGEGADVLIGTAGANHLRGYGGKDRLEGRAGSDTLEGGAGRGGFVTGVDDDLLLGGDGDDRLFGERGNDELFGGREDDRIVGGRGVDRFDAGPGADRLNSIDTHRELVRCGGGRDAARVDRKDARRGCERVRRKLEVAGHRGALVRDAAQRAEAAI